MAGKAGIAFVEIRFNPGDLERMMAEAKAAGKEIASDTSDEVNKNGSIWKSLLSNWKLLVPAITAASVALLGFTGNLSVLAPLLPIMTGFLTAALVPFTTLAALLVGFIPPVTLLVGLLGGLGVAFGLAGKRALDGGKAFKEFSSIVKDIKKNFGDLTTTLAHDFLPILTFLAQSANNALIYLDKIAHLPLKQAFDSLATTGVAGFQKFLDKIGSFLKKPITLAFQVAFGKNDTLRNALVDDWNAIVKFFGSRKIGLPIEKWFGKQNFTAVGYRWGAELAGAIVAGMVMAIQHAWASRGGKLILGGAGAGAALGAYLGGPIGAAMGLAIGAGAGAVLNHYWPKIAAGATSAFRTVERVAKRALGPELWGQIISLAKSFWDTLKAIGGYIQNHVFPVVKHVFAALGGWHTVGLIIVGVIRVIVTTFVAVGQAVKIVYNTILSLVRGAQHVANVVKGALVSAWDGVVTAVDIVSNAVNSIVSAIQTAVGAAKSLASALSSVHLPSLPSLPGGLHLPHTGGIVTPTGMRFAGGGIARGGIPGRDSVPALLTPGEVVLNEAQQMALLRGGIRGDTNVQVFIDGKEIESAVYKVQRRTARAVQAGSRWG